jgi:RimJ/RimL family protein N-acetyltransferase
MALNHISHEFTFRRAGESDCKKVWDLSNDPVVRNASFSSDSIPWENHIQWFAAKLLDANCFFYIIETMDESFIGQVRYDIQDKQAIVSVALTSQYRGKGYASRVLYKSTQAIFESTTVDLIRAYIKPDNTVSLRAFTKSGFASAGTVDVRGHQALEFILRR